MCLKDILNPGRRARPLFFFGLQCLWGRWTGSSASRKKKPSKPSLPSSRPSGPTWCWSGWTRIRWVCFFLLFVWTTFRWVCSSKSWKQGTRQSCGASLRVTPGGSGSSNTQTWNTSRKTLRNFKEINCYFLKRPTVRVGDILFQEVPNLETSCFGHILCGGGHDKVHISNWHDKLIRSKFKAANFVLNSKMWIYQGTV